MPDDRMIHPRLGHSAKVCSLTDLEARVWAMGYLLAADDCGVMRCSAVTVQSANEALAKRPTRAIERCLKALVDIGLLMEFEHQGRRYVCQWDWNDWQKVRYPRPSTNPDPPPEVMSKCSESTQHLFRLRADLQKKNSGKIPEIDQHPTGAGGRERLPAQAMATGNGSAPKLPSPPDARSKRPIFTGQRFAVFEWQFSDLERLLGKHFEAFDLHAFFFDLDAKAAASGQVIPQRDGGQWLQAQVMAEAQRRGLAIAAATLPKAGPRSTVPNAEATRRHLQLEPER